eukprot:TRINITY_DN4556_c0_g2_i3.p1 TRINITY_DN4556_c0_g2~~TRINITY_DN4556_c0_g2_i3.p1  ORF type:complete len:239 (-),score=19.09 TRINITY_DN4556_c0_g2_i3:41-757(-)
MCIRDSIKITEVIEEIREILGPANTRNGPNNSVMCLIHNEFHTLEEVLIKAVPNFSGRVRDVTINQFNLYLQTVAKNLGLVVATAGVARIAYAGAQAGRVTMLAAETTFAGVGALLHAGIAGYVHGENKKYQSKLLGGGASIITCLQKIEGELEQLKYSRQYQQVLSDLQRFSDHIMLIQPWLELDASQLYLPLRFMFVLLAQKLSYIQRQTECQKLPYRDYRVSKKLLTSTKNAYIM